MKFEYEHERDDSKCVAYIDSFGHLIILNKRSTEYSERKSFVLMPLKHGSDTTDWDTFEPSGAERKFYPGDKITITF